MGPVCATTSKTLVDNWFNNNFTACSASCSASVQTLQINKCYYRFLHELSGGDQLWVRHLQLMCRGLNLGLFFGMILSAMLGAPILLYLTGKVMIPASSQISEILAPFVDQILEKFYGPKVKTMGDFWACFQR